MTTQHRNESTELVNLVLQKTMESENLDEGSESTVAVHTLPEPDIRISVDDSVINYETSDKDDDNDELVISSSVFEKAKKKLPFVVEICNKEDDVQRPPFAFQGPHENGLFQRAKGSEASDLTELDLLRADGLFNNELS